MIMKILIIWILIILKIISTFFNPPFPVREFWQKIESIHYPWAEKDVKRIDQNSLPWANDYETIAIWERHKTEKKLKLKILLNFFK